MDTGGDKVKTYQRTETREARLKRGGLEVEALSESYGWYGGHERG
jgi:hypothetical protein